MSTLAIALGLGVAFGAILQRSGVGRPDFVLGGLTLRDLSLMKLMALAIGVGAIGIGVLAALGLASFAVKPLYLVGVTLGGLVFGAGFALTGYCPGTSLVASAEGRRDAWFTVLGALAGAGVYVVVHPFLAPYLVEPLSFGAPTVGDGLGLTPTVAGVVLGALFVAAAFALPTHPGARRAPPHGTSPARTHGQGALS